MQTTMVRNRRGVVIGLLILGVLFGAAALLVYRQLKGIQKLSETNLGFVTIDQAEHPGNSSKVFMSSEPGLLVITDRQDIQAASRFLPPTAVLRLERLNFRTSFAILVFRGLSPTVHEGFYIKQLIRQGDEVTILAEPGTRTGRDALTSPYQLISVRKEGQWESVITFELYFDPVQPPAAIVSEYIP